MSSLTSHAEDVERCVRQVQYTVQSCQQSVEDLGLEQGMVLSEVHISILNHLSDLLTLANESVDESIYELADLSYEIDYREDGNPMVDMLFRVVSDILEIFSSEDVSEAQQQKLRALGCWSSFGQWGLPLEVVRELGAYG